MRPVPPFSVLLPVYAGDRPEFIRRAFASVAEEQSLRPDEVVIVRDGQVPAEIAACVSELRATSTVATTIVRLPERRGLGPALDAGLRACSHDVIARMDADDIALPQRFERQLPLMRTADIVGAGLLELSSGTGEIVGRRTPPVGHDTILRYARAHDPFNHPTVVYRRSAVLAAGGYGDLPLMEDYWLFARMLAAGARAANIAEPLVYYRVGKSSYQRRGGWQLMRSEIRLQRQFRDEGFTTTFEHLRNTVVRGGYRLLPWRLRQVTYRGAVALYRAFTDTPAEQLALAAPRALPAATPPALPAATPPALPAAALPATPMRRQSYQPELTR
ncbi:MAG: glycosyltransferase [Trebonia sp.]